MLCPTDRKVGCLSFSENPPGFPASGVWSQSQVSWRELQEFRKSTGRVSALGTLAVSPGAVMPQLIPV